MSTELQKKISISVEQLSSINRIDLADLCNITEQAIKAGGGFGWLKVPPRDTLNKYWKGVVLVKNRKLIVGRLNDAIAGTLQLIFQPSNNEAQQNICNGTNFAQLDIRETQEAAIQLFKSKGYKHWGTNPNYALVDGKNIKGFYFLKQLK